MSNALLSYTPVVQHAMTRSMNSLADSYTVLWAADEFNSFVKAGEIGKPLQVIFGGEHQSVPSLSKFKVKAGDHVFPIRVHKRALYVIARLTISKIISLEEYFTDELCVSKKDLKLHVWDLQDKLNRKHPELGHRVPYGCVFEAGLGAGTPMTIDCVYPPELLHEIRYSSNRGERPIKHVSNGQITHTVSLSGGVYRLSPSSAEVFHALVDRRHDREARATGNGI